MRLSDSIWWTRKARVHTEKRLLSHAFHSKVILLWYSFFSVAVSIYYLKHPQNDNASISWVVYSILTLTMSGFINGLSLKERAVLIKECYEKLKTLYCCARIAESSDGDTSKISEEYTQILNTCENHTEEDYIVVLCQQFLMAKDKNNIDPHPTWYCYYIAGIFYVKRFIFLLIFYTLPLIILFFMNFNLFNILNFM